MRTRSLSARDTGPPKSWYCYRRIYSPMTRRRVKALSRSHMQEAPPWRCLRGIFRLRRQTRVGPKVQSIIIMKHYLRLVRALKARAVCGRSSGRPSQARRSRLTFGCVQKSGTTSNSIILVWWRKHCSKNQRMCLRSSNMYFTSHQTMMVRPSQCHLVQSISIIYITTVD